MKRTMAPWSARPVRSNATGEPLNLFSSVTMGGYGYIRRTEVLRHRDGTTYIRRMTGIRRLGTTGTGDFTITDNTRKVKPW